MKKYIILISIFLAFMAALLIVTTNLDKQFETGVSEIAETEDTTGLGDYYLSENYGGNITNVPGEESTEITVEPIEPQLDSQLTKDDIDDRVANGITGQNLAQVMYESTGLFSYDMMRPECHQLYAEIYILLSGMYPSTYLCSISLDDIDYTYNCVLQDHPEIFYIQGYDYKISRFGNIITKISFQGHYTMDVKKVTDMNRTIRAYRDRFLAAVSSKATDYEKVKYTYEFIILNTEYDLEAPENQNMCSVFAYGKSVCQGYAKAFQYLLGLVGVKCTMVTGYVGGGEAHAWNLVYIDNAYYYVDPTWGDSSYTGGESNSKALSSINYDYLLITTEEICRTHTIDNVIEPPRCVATESNYFVKEDLYFTTIDRRRLKKAFTKAYATNKGILTIKCSDSLCYQYMQNELITNQEIFDYVNVAGDTLSYAMNDDQFTLAFKLH